MKKDEKVVLAHKVEFTHKWSWKKMKKEWRWKTTSISNLGKEITGASSQGYTHKSDCEYNLQSVSVSGDNYYNSIGSPINRSHVIINFD